jgi:hypothetical protein
MSCNCNGSANLGSQLNRLSLAEDALINGYNQFSTPLSSQVYSQNFNTAPVVNPLSTQNFTTSPVNFNAVPLYSPVNFSTRPVVNPSVFTASNVCSPLTSATFTTARPVDQIYTNNPQITSTNVGNSILMSSSSVLNTPNRFSSVPVAVPHLGARYSNYLVTSTPTYINSCP